MEKQELIEKVGFVLGDGHKELQMFGFIAGNDNPYRISISDELESVLIDVIAEGIQSLLVDKEYEIVSFSTADERKDRYYLYDLEEIPERMMQMSYVIGNHNVESFDLQQHDVTEINTLILTLSDGDGHTISLFKLLSSVEKVVKSTKSVLARFGIGEDMLEEEKSSMLRIGPRFQIVYTDDSYIFLDSSAAETTFDLHQVLNNEAARNIQVIADTHLLKDVVKLQQYTDKLPFSRKLVGVMRNSKVIKNNIPKNQVLEFIANDVKLREQLKIEEVEGERYIDIRSIKSAKCFLDLLNDEFLYSKLTGQDYQAVDKDER